MREFINIIESFAGGDFYHGTSRENLSFKGVAYFTSDLKIATEYAEMDASVDGDRPQVIRANLAIKNPAYLSTRQMQDLHSLPDMVADLIHQGHDAVLSNDPHHATEVAVLDTSIISIKEVIQVEATIEEGVPLISHSDEDEKWATEQMESWLRIQTRHGAMKPVGSVNGLRIETNTSFPGTNLRPFFFLFDGETIVGFCILQKFIPQPDGDKRWFVKMIFILPKYRGGQLALHLYKHFIDQGIDLVCGEKQTLASQKNWEKLATMGLDVEEVDGRLVAKKKQTALAEGKNMKLSAKGFKAWLSNPTTFDYEMDWVEEGIEDMGGIKAAFTNSMKWTNSLPDPIPVWRGLPIEDVDAWLESPVQANGHVGLSWAFTEKGAFDNQFSRGNTTVVLAGHVEKSSVDWYCTWALGIADGEEDEMRLIAGAPVQVHEAWILDENYKVIEKRPMVMRLKA